MNNAPHTRKVTILNVTAVLDEDVAARLGKEFVVGNIETEAGKNYGTLFDGTYTYAVSFVDTNETPAWYVTAIIG